MSTRNWWLATTVIVVLHILLTWVHPHADPPMGYSQDFSQITDGYWYLDSARAAATGSESSVDGNYDQPLITAPAYVVFKLLGTNLATARVLNSLASVAVVLLLAFATRQRFGLVPSLVAILVFAVQPLWIAYTRSPVIYPYAATWLFASLLLASGPTWRHYLAGSSLLLLGGLLLKSIVFLALPCLVLDGLHRSGHLRMRSRATWGFLAGAAAIVTATAVAAERFMDKILWYTGWSNIFENIAEFHARTGLFSAAPVLILMSLSALLLVRHRKGEVGRFEVMAHLTVWGTIILFATCRYSPARYLLVVFPLMAYTTATVVIPVARNRVVLGSLAAILAISVAPASYRIVAQPTHALARMSQQLPAMIPSDALVFGTFAHAATFSTELAARNTFKLEYGDGKLARYVEENRVTHLLFDSDQQHRIQEIFRRDGVEVDLLETFSVHHTEVSLYRCTEAGPRSDFEVALGLLQHGELEEAGEKFRGVLEQSPWCASAWVGMGRVAEGKGDTDLMVRCLKEAVVHDPGNFRAQMKLAELFGKNGYEEEAWFHLNQASAAVPGNERLQELIKSLQVSESP